MIAISLFFWGSMCPARGPLVHAEIRHVHAHLQQAKWNAYCSYKTIGVLKYRKQGNLFSAVSLHDQLF
jgi:hypothetical protein